LSGRFPSAAGKPASQSAGRAIKWKSLQQSAGHCGSQLQDAGQVARVTAAMEFANPSRVNRLTISALITPTEIRK
jgi:hypothetical protein